MEDERPQRVLWTACDRCELARILTPRSSRAAGQWWPAGDGYCGVSSPGGGVV